MGVVNIPGGMADPGMAFDPVKRNIFLIEENSDTLYRVDRDNATATPVGSGLGLPFDLFNSGPQPV